MKQTFRLLVAAAGAGAAFSGWWGFAGTRPEGTGTEWTLSRPAVELSAAALAGPLRNDPAHLDLGGNRSAEAPVPLKGAPTLRIRATIPEGGQLLVRTGRVPRGAAAPQRPAGPPGPGPRLPRGGSEPARDPSTLSPTFTFDYGPSHALHASGGFTCTPLSLPSGELDATVETQASATIIRVGGAEARCTGSRLEGPWMLRSGVERVRVVEVQLTTADGTRTLLGAGPWYTRPWAGVLAAALGALLGLAPVPRAARPALIPLMLSPLLAAFPTAGWLESLRMLALPEALVPLLAGVIPAAISSIFLIASRHTLRHTLLAGAVPLALTLTLWLRYPDAPGWSLLAAGFLPLAGLAWANARRVRGVGAWSWAALLLLLGLAEAGVRHTALDNTWVRTAGYERAAKEFQELLELREYRSYPSEGFPVRPPEPRAGVSRIVAFGGSSTGGAFQMDDIDQFWPKKLEEQIASPEWEVVNQGVGGWNSLHIRLYVESQLQTLQPDILVLYLGHNDLMSAGATTHRALLDQYRSPPNAALTAVSRTLHASRLFVGFKFFLLSWRGDAAVAVPITDARENLRAILDVAAAQSAHVLLVSEGMNPDPAPMVPYARLLDELAAATGQRAFDAAGRFSAEANPDDFLDDCHLTVGGHERLAAWIRAELTDAGWLKGASSPSAP